MTPNTQQNSRELAAEKIVREWKNNHGGTNYEALRTAIATEFKSLLERVEKAEKENLELSEALDTRHGETVSKWMECELADYSMCLDHLTKVYDHFSRGRISKPNTLPSEVISIADEFESDEINKAIDEATAELCTERDQLARDKARLVEACKPFAEIVKFWASNVNDEIVVASGSEDGKTLKAIRLKHARTLAALLKEME